MPLVTRQRLVHDLRELGVEPGSTLLVHASLRSIGWVEGGARAVISALRQVVGGSGNVVTPTGTEENSLTSRRHRARIAAMTPDQAQRYRREMPPFDKDTTPSGMGMISEALRTARGAVRSAHPQSSFSAIGPDAGHLMADHQLECHLGEYSPLAKLYKMDARVLMIGVGYQACTAFHLAEYRYKEPPPSAEYSCAVIENGLRRWIEYKDVVLDDEDFEEIGKTLNRDRGAFVEKGYVGDAGSLLVPLVQAVDHAKGWMAHYRASPRSPAGHQLL
jgi:aminoglycoside 3-N-acetyltransferase